MDNARTAVVVSPHRDDAAFSIGATLRWLIAKGVRVTLVSCFTESAWAPVLGQDLGTAAITRIRESEDIAFVRLLGEQVTLLGLGLLDGPLRPDRHPYKMWPEVNEHPLSADCIASLREVLAPLAKPDTVWMIPLALEHPDHAIAHVAAVAAAGRAPTLFYEDIPYVYWFSEGDVAVRARKVQELLGVEIQPRVLHGTDYIEGWLSGVSCYGSQFPPQQVRSMSRILQARGGERCWTTAAFDRWCNEIA